MKYVIMFTSTPELDAAVPPERAEEVYRRVYDWFGTHAEKISDSGAELQPVTTATTVTLRRRRARRRGRAVLRGEGGHRRFQRARRRRPRRRDRASSRPGRCSSCPASPSRSVRWSWTTATWSNERAGCRGAGLGASPGPRHPISSSRTCRARGVRPHRRRARRVARQSSTRRGGGRRGDRGGRCASGACAGFRPIPAAWLTQAARHNALDRLRRETRYREKLALLAEPDLAGPDGSRRGRGR